MRRTVVESVESVEAMGGRKTTTPASPGRRAAQAPVAARAAEGELRLRGASLAARRGHEALVQHAAQDGGEARARGGAALRRPTGRPGARRRRSGWRPSRRPARAVRSRRRSRRARPTRGRAISLTSRHVGVLPRRPRAAGRDRRDVQPDLALDDHAALVLQHDLDRVLDRDDAAGGWSVIVVDQRRERAWSCRRPDPGHQHQAGARARPDRGTARGRPRLSSAGASGGTRCMEIVMPPPVLADVNALARARRGRERDGDVARGARGCRAADR